MSAANRLGQRKRGGHETELGYDLIFGFSFYLADSEAEAKTAGIPILEEYQKMLAPRSALPERSAMTSYSDSGSPSSIDRGYGNPRRRRRRWFWLVGPPERIIDTLGELQETSAVPGDGRSTCWCATGNHLRADGALRCRRDA